MDQEPVHVTQSVEVAPLLLIVTLHMVNRSAKPVLLERFNDALEPWKREFEIKAGEQTIRYTGAMVKRLPYTKKDFFVLEPGKEYTRKTRIDRVYEFLNGTHEYSMVHWHLQFDEEQERTVAHASSPMNFIFTR